MSFPRRRKVWRRLLSVKLRLSLWYAGFILIIVGVMLSALPVLQSNLSTDFYYDKLTETAAAAAQSIRFTQSGMQLDTHPESGVHVTVLDENAELLVGSRSFSLRINDKTPMRFRMADSDSGWYILDRSIVSPDGTPLWLRCYISTAVTDRNYRVLVLTLSIMIPLLLAITLVGGYLMTRFIFRPIDEISRTAASISSSNDLKRRIGLGERNDEVGKLAETFDAMFARLERSLESEKRFISNASHELRTPLTVICTQSEYALAPGRSFEEVITAMRTINERGKRTSKMLSKMLELSRMDSHKQVLHLESAPLSEVLEALIQEMQLRADERGVQLVCEAEEGIEYVCDELLWMRMATNLIENAIRHGREGGRVEIKLVRCKGELIFSVSDDGPGIAREEQDKIWARFYQIEKSRSEGSGLGLPIVKWIVEAHGGTITLDSARGKGSLFTVSLPIAG